MAAVTHAEGEGVLALKEITKLPPGSVIKQDTLCPALPCSEDVSVRETAARHQTVDILQALPTRHDVAHMHVDRSEARTIKGRRHLHLAVHTLLSQNRDARAYARGNVRRGNILVAIKGQ